MSVAPPSVFREYPAVVFVNSAAGGNRTRIHLPRIKKLFESLQLHAEFVMTKSASELESTVRTAFVQKHRLLLAMGGDGTFQALANAAFGADVVLGVLPVGGETISPPHWDCRATRSRPRRPSCTAKLALWT